MPDVLAALRWLVVLQVVSLAGLPLARRLFAHLPDRGYAFARPLALLLATYLLWLLGVFGFLTVQASTLAFALAAVVALGLLLGGRPRLTPAERRSALAVEAVFAGAFVVAVLVRAYNPEIAATEKPMEFAFLNAILRRGALPPHDPWLSGYAISYYYLGYVMVAAVSRLAAVSAAQAFNLGLATLFALTVTGAFGIVRNMVALAGRGDGASTVGRSRAPFVFGALAALAVAAMGNLAGFLDALHSRGLGPAAFWRWLDIKDLLEPPAPGSWLPERTWWWWRASRVINDRSPLGEPMEVINEFPFFSFLLGDLHAHVLALPFALLAVALCLEWALRLRRRPEPRAHGGFLALAAVSIGGLGFLNTWDWPVYVALFALASWLALPGPPLGRRLGKAAVLAATLLLAGVVAYLPFYLSLQTQASGVLPTFFVSTKLRQYGVMFGPFLFVVAAFVGHRLLEAGPAVWRRALLWAALIFVVPFAFLTLVGVGLMVVPSGQAVLAQLRGLAEVRQVAGDLPWSSVLLRLLGEKLASGGVLLLVSVVAGSALALMERAPNEGEPAAEAEAEAAVAADPPAGADARVPAAFALALIAVGLLLTWAVEFVYLRDYFGTRMNTVFKFYYQAWVLLALASAYGAYHLWARLRGGVRWGFTVVAAALFLMGMAYPVMATWTKTDRFRGSPTLDGMAHLAHSSPADYEAIRWLNDNVAGAPVIVEASGGSYTMFARVSANTGLPTLYGWDFHEHQWRGGGHFQGRQEEVRQVYTARHWLEVQAVLERHGVDYVYVGPLERQAYGPQAGDLVARQLPLVYQSPDGSGEVRIYAVR